MTIRTSTTTGNDTRDDALRDASSDAEGSGSGEGGVRRKPLGDTPFTPVGQAHPLVLSLVEPTDLQNQQALMLL